MRLIIIGTERARRTLRDLLETSPPDVVGEFGSLAEARAAGIGADAMVAAAPPRPG